MRARPEHSCCGKQPIKRGFWSPEEDMKLIRYVIAHGHGCWSSLPNRAGLQRCGKSCRLRWMNYLRPGIKRGNFTKEEERTIILLHRIMANRWAQIAKYLPGRTDSEIKNYWNTCLKKRLATSHDKQSSDEGSEPAEPAGTHYSAGDLQGNVSLPNNSFPIDMDFSDTGFQHCKPAELCSCPRNLFGSVHDNILPFQVIKENSTAAEADTSWAESSQDPSQTLMQAHVAGMFLNQDDIVKSYPNEHNNFPSLVDFDCSDIHNNNNNINNSMRISSSSSSSSNQLPLFGGIDSTLAMFSPDLPGPHLLQQ